MKQPTVLSRLARAVLCLILTAVSVSTITACANHPSEPGVSVPESIDEASVTDRGEGATAFLFSVVDADGRQTTYRIHTDAATVGEALVALDLIAGDTDDYGLYVKSVDGIVADWDVDHTYWAFYVNGEYAFSGVDKTPIKPGETYAMKIES